MTGGWSWCAMLIVLLQVSPRGGGNAGEVGAGPEPSPVAVAWEMELRFLDPQRLEIIPPGKTVAETYWYMVYTVVNQSDRTQRFFPRFQLVTEDLKVYDTDIGVPPYVINQIRTLHRETHPEMMAPSEAIGDLRAGEDYARESVAVWRDVQMSGNQFRIYVAGLSGEARLQRNPAYDPKKPETEKVTVNGREEERTVNPRHFTLRKTLELTYLLPGARDARQAAQIVRQSVRWIMR